VTHPTVGADPCVCPNNSEQPARSPPHVGMGFIAHQQAAMFPADGDKPRPYKRVWSAGFEGIRADDLPQPLQRREAIGSAPTRTKHSSI
jgi:hypothetical protein